MGWPIDVDGWGSSEEERKAAYPCDALIDDPDRVLFRAVDVAAPADLVFRCSASSAPPPTATTGSTISDGRAPGG